MAFTIKTVSEGFAIYEDGERCDWPTIATMEEAKRELADFKRAARDLARDEASEAFGFAHMGPLER